MRLAAAVLALGCLACANGPVQCATNLDCVPATCCHADHAVPKDQAPSCTNATCTDDYQICTDDDAAVFPTCALGRCVMAKPPYCPPDSPVS